MLEYEYSNGFLLEETASTAEINAEELLEFKIAFAICYNILLEKVLSGDDTPAKYLVLANAGAALLAANRTESLIDGVNLAKQSIDTGSATKILESFIKLSNTLD